MFKRHVGIFICPELVGDNLVVIKATYATATGTTITGRGAPPKVPLAPITRTIKGPKKLILRCASYSSS